MTEILRESKPWLIPPSRGDIVAFHLGAMPEERTATVRTAQDAVNEWAYRYGVRITPRSGPRATGPTAKDSWEEWGERVACCVHSAAAGRTTTALHLVWEWRLESGGAMPELLAQHVINAVGDRGLLVPQLRPNQVGVVAVLTRADTFDLAAGGSTWTTRVLTARERAQAGRCAESDRPNY